MPGNKKVRTNNMKTVFTCTNPSCGIELFVDEAAINPANPKVRCSRCKKVINIKEALRQNTAGSPAHKGRKKIHKDEILAWLVVHDEHTERQVLGLKAGKHVVGRKSASKPCDVMIQCDHDPYMSRHHCMLEVRISQDGMPEVILSDNKSTNGTWLNAEEKVELQDEEKLFLEDNDMLQLGMTKVIVKIKQGAVATENDASAEVYRKPHGKTRII